MNVEFKQALPGRSGTSNVFVCWNLFQKPSFGMQIVDDSVLGDKEYQLCLSVPGMSDDDRRYECWIGIPTELLNNPFEHVSWQSEIIQSIRLIAADCYTPEKYAGTVYVPTILENIKAHIQELANKVEKK